jgi:hypothetical protein
LNLLIGCLRVSPAAPCAPTAARGEVGYAVRVLKAVGLSVNFKAVQPMDGGEHFRQLRIAAKWKDRGRARLSEFR